VAKEGSMHALDVMITKEKHNHHGKSVKNLVLNAKHSSQSSTTGNTQRLIDFSKFIDTDELNSK
jgi:hypothetical protein